MVELVVYGSPVSPFVRKVETVLQEKGLEYDFENVNIMDLPDWYREINPLGRIPVLRDKSIAEQGVAGSIPDSSAICGYLEKKAGPPMLPAGAYETGRTLWYEEYADAEMAGLIGMGLFRPIMFPRFAGKESDVDTARKTYTEKLPPVFDYLETSLDDGEFFVANQLTLADISIASQLAQLDLVVGPPDSTKWPGLAKHYAAMILLKGMASNMATCQKMLSRVLPEKIDLGQSG